MRNPFTLALGKGENRAYCPEGESLGRTWLQCQEPGEPLRTETAENQSGEWSWEKPQLKRIAALASVTPDSNICLTMWMFA